MNDAYSEEMAPPKWMFSRTWWTIYGTWSSERESPWFYYNDRIDKIKRKLEDLKTKLMYKKGGNHSYSSGHDLLIDTIEMLITYIGIWKVALGSNTPRTVEIKMLYPDEKQRMPECMGVCVMGEKFSIENKTLSLEDHISNVCVVMLSSECVEWLNMVSDYIGE